MSRAASADRWKACGPWLAVALMGLVQLWALPGDYLGREHDDAHYVLAARSLLRGEYRLGISPGDPPLTIIPPGWPILLMPAAALSGDDPAGYHLTAWLFLLACDALVLVWLRRRMKPAAALWGTALFALNPLVLARAGKVMTEVPALAFVLALCAAADSEAWPSWASGGMLAFSWLIRQRATAMLAAVWTWYASRRRWRDLAVSAAAPAAVFLAWSWWLGRAGSGMPETGEWAAAYSSPSDFFAAAGSNAAYYLRLWGRLWLPYYPASAFAEILSGACFGSACLAGLWRLVARRGLEPALGWLLFGGIMHWLWPWQYDRYLLPFLPMLIWGLLEAAEAVRAPSGLKHAALALLLAGQLLGQGVPILSGRFVRAAPELAETYAWIRGHLPPQAVVASPFFSRDALYTGRPCAPLPAAVSGPELLRDLKLERVGYVLLEEDLELGLSLGAEGFPRRQLERLRRSLAHAPFKEVYRNRREGSVLYSL